MNLNLIDAFGRFGATPSNRVRGLSAIATDGAVVLNCSEQHFAHPSRGVLRYEGRLSQEPQDSKDVALLGQHLALARDSALPIRMVVAFSSDPKRGASRGYHVRPDLIGKVVKFDGDHFMIDFTRPEEASRAAGSSGRR
jgi:class 3 adenylate cyclase